MIISLQKTVTPSLVAAFEKLLPQLNTSIAPPTFKELESLIASENTFLFTGEVDGIIVGTISLVIYRIPTGLKAWIEDVIVDETVRGRGYGKQLIEHAIGFLRGKEIRLVNLTSGPARVAANKMYQQLGFELRETNVYRLELK